MDRFRELQSAVEKNSAVLAIDARLKELELEGKTGSQKEELLVLEELVRAGSVDLELITGSEDLVLPPLLAIRPGLRQKLPGDLPSFLANTPLLRKKL